MATDRELVTRVTGSDDQAAFQLLVERHQAAIRGFLLRLTAGDGGTADDLAQETFLLAYRKLHTLKAGGSLVSWLHTIAYRQFLQDRRKQARQRVMAEPPEPGHDPRQAMDASILLPALLSHVNEQERACLTLAYAEGMSHSEIGEITGLALGTVKSHISRGKRKLQEWLLEHDHSLSGPGRAGGLGKETNRA
ncbi:MAG: RNA polymerase sigma factor [Xanthomonadales bacterium]|nr:RNA polymerase sigma factor [Gammaproteobacteria bacterium]MBT8050166.1 RNA polymerase sigma factor [Gammaproteobacteria bacterium]MBT8057899.1 RNA polymerase sigma factor [Gammaproteobacteria bacterium]NNJ78405.1 RNA polymerase sigma factor [Xanthomonadales bacterium]NNL03998.1 RNA polymerase sigma factor [Xanthomonadales bacterium]